MLQYSKSCWRRAVAGRNLILSSKEWLQNTGIQNAIPKMFLVLKKTDSTYQHNVILSSHRMKKARNELIKIFSESYLQHLTTDRLQPLNYSMMKSSALSHLTLYCTNCLVLELLSKPFYQSDRCLCQLIVHAVPFLAS